MNHIIQFFSSKNLFAKCRSMTNFWKISNHQSSVVKLQTQIGLVSNFRRIAASLFSIDFALLKNSSEWILAHTLTISLTEAPGLHRLARKMGQHLVTKSYKRKRNAHFWINQSPTSLTNSWRKRFAGALSENNLDTLILYFRSKIVPALIHQR